MSHSKQTPGRLRDVKNNMVNKGTRSCSFQTVPKEVKQGDAILSERTRTVHLMVQMFMS